ncbi:MAG: metal-dependent hydrolase [Deltaproteobacteria bacterium]|nr:metal-dependent hydrolase [Deltaproteobacteria bacterium]
MSSFAPARSPVADPAVPIRPLVFDLEAAHVPPDWYAGDRTLSLFWTALSLLFPEGERFFVESVKHYRDQISDPVLQEQIAGFMAQEAMHGKGHRALNALCADQGIGIQPALERQLRGLLIGARRVLSPKSRLAVTCALEHMTALMAEQLLGDPRHHGAIDPSLRGLWLWHALEEAEHKAVAFDVYRAVGGGYARRTAIMLLATAIFVLEVMNVWIRLVRADGARPGVRGWARAVGFLFGKPGLVRRQLPGYLAYFRPGFHPDRRDTGALVEIWRARLFGEGGLLTAALAARARS